MREVYLPAYSVGVDAIASSGSAFRRLGQNGIIIGGHHALDAAGESLRDALKKADVHVADTVWYGGECTYAHMRRLAERAKACGADMVIGVGGGKALDTAKGCADMLGLPIITVPTIASTCAAVTAISVVYDDSGVFLESMFHQSPPNYTVIDTGILANAPECYLRAGIGDAMAKHIECTLASRGRTLNHSSSMAVALSSTTYQPNLLYGEAAMAEAKAHAAGEALEQVALANIVSTGLVSLLIDEHYNGAIAHAVFYGMTRLPGFEKRVLHGDCVGYGMLVQEMVDGNRERFETLRAFFARMGIPTTIAQMGYVLDEQLLAHVVPASLKALRDARLMPYELTEEQLRHAITAVEHF